MVERGDAVAAALAGQASTVLQVGAGLPDGDLGVGDSEVKGM